MRKHGLRPALLQSRLCRQHGLPIRQFHSSSIRGEDKPSDPSSRRVASRKVVYKSLDNLAASSVTAADTKSPPPQSSKLITRVPFGNPSESSDPKKVIYRRADPSIIRSQKGGPPLRPKHAGPSPPRRGGPERSPRRTALASGAADGSGRKARRPRNAPARARGESENDDIGPIDVTNYEYLCEEYGDSFSSIEEVQNYAQVLDLLDAHEEHEERVRSLELDARLPEGQKSLSPQKRQELEAEVKDKNERFDGLIKEALQHVIDTEAQYMPWHEPADDSVVRPAKGLLGGTPIGLGGLGQLVEDGIRHLSRRESMEYEDPKPIAAKLVAGDFVKFRNPNERNTVMQLAEHMEWEDGQDFQKENVGFEPLSDGAKRILVETLVKGHYLDPKDKDLKGNAISSVARLATGNGTYPSASKDQLLATIREVMPQEREAISQGQAK